jgi:hypothetical protein
VLHRCQSIRLALFPSFPIVLSKVAFGLGPLLATAAYWLVSFPGSWSFLPRRHYTHWVPYNLPDDLFTDRSHRNHLLLRYSFFVHWSMHEDTFCTWHDTTIVGRCVGMPDTLPRHGVMDGSLKSWLTFSLQRPIRGGLRKVVWLEQCTMCRLDANRSHTVTPLILAALVCGVREHRLHHYRPWNGVCTAKHHQPVVLWVFGWHEAWMVDGAQVAGFISLKWIRLGRQKTAMSDSECLMTIDGWWWWWWWWCV